MKHKPRPPKESIFAHGIGFHIVWVGTWIGITTLLGFVWALNRNGGEIFDPTEESLAVARTVAFSVLALSQVFHVSAIHSGIAAFWQVPLWRNKLLLLAVIATVLLQMLVIYEPFMQEIMGTVDLDGTELLVTWLLGGSLFVAVETEKTIRRRIDPEG